MSNPIFIETISYEMDIEDKIYFDQLLDIVRNKYDGVIADILLLRLEKYKDTEVCDIINQEHGTHYTRHSLQMMLRRELPKVVSVLKKHGAF